jgi:hypothetical protein
MATKKDSSSKEEDNFPGNLVYMKYLHPQYDEKALRTAVIEFVGFIREENEDSYLMERYFQARTKDGQRLHDNLDRFTAILKAAVVKKVDLMPKKEAKKRGPAKKRT